MVDWDGCGFEVGVDMGELVFILEFGVFIFDWFDIVVGLVYGKDEWVGGIGVDDIIVFRRSVIKSGVSIWNKR